LAHLAQMFSIYATRNSDDKTYNKICLDCDQSNNSCRIIFSYIPLKLLSNSCLFISLVGYTLPWEISVQSPVLCISISEQFCLKGRTRKPIRYRT